MVLYNDDGCREFITRKWTGTVPQRFTVSESVRVESDLIGFRTIESDNLGSSLLRLGVGSVVRIGNVRSGNLYRYRQDSKGAALERARFEPYLVAVGGYTRSYDALVIFYIRILTYDPPTTLFNMQPS